VVLDMPFQNYWGNYVMHCHILDHEDAGMMARISVQK
jgi:FtsP/CotA-like multicopper oxidase with cupredoxin domain